MKVLEVKDLNIVLDNEEIIRDLSFELNQGDVLTILGPNGAGKTVLLKLLLNILPYRGEVKWREGIKIGYVPQRLPFIKEIPMNVRDFFRLKEASVDKIERVAVSVGFEPKILDKKVGDISSGQFQRVLIAWALLGDPDVLLFDEPTTGVDIVSEETIYALLSRIKKEKNLTILMVTHDLSVVFKFSNFVICLNRYPICQGAPKEILDQKALQELYGEEVKFYQHL